MLGQYGQRHSQAQQAISRLAGRVSACSYPLLYCQAGQVVGYALDAYVAGRKQKQTFYFDADWQPLTAAPVGALMCCEDRNLC